tara:strand:- start:165 stop:848 length:684 start_codon:yes stop_codon:yes gene_type:complete
MNTGEVYNFFRSLIDEDDETFLTKAQAVTMLSEAYREFRDLVVSIQPDVFTKQAFITLNNTNKYDLTVPDTAPPNIKFLSSASNGGATSEFKIQRLVRIARIDSTTSNQVTQYLNPRNNVELLCGDDYARQGTNICFGYDYTETMRIEFVPYHTVDFDAASGFIDNLDQFHPLIALMAAKYYEVRDNAENTALERRRQEKIRELKTWLTRFWRGGVAQSTQRLIEVF